LGRTRVRLQHEHGPTALRAGRPEGPSAVLAAAGLPHQRFHDLRHAFATLQLEAGADVFEVSRALGHASIATTANIYGHFTRAMAERSADPMTAILGEPASG
jgi:integrase